MFPKNFNVICKFLGCTIDKFLGGIILSRNNSDMIFCDKLFRGMPKIPAPPKVKGGTVGRRTAG